MSRSLSSMDSLNLETLHVAGTPHEMGLGQGEAFRERIQRFVDVRLTAVSKYFADRGRGDQWQEVLTAGALSMDIHKKWHPEGHAEHLGIAEGAGVDAARLFTATNMTDLRDAVLLKAPSGPPLSGPSEGGLAAGDMACSSVLIPPGHSKTDGPLAGQTWDLNPTDVDFIVAIHRSPTEGPKTWAITCTGCLSLIGINEEGVTVGTTNIKTYGSRPGVGYLSILHRALQAKDVAEAKRLVQEAPHAGAHTYWLADAEQQLEWEASPNGQFLRTTAEGPIWRTNHCLVDTHKDLQGELPGDSSVARFKRMEAVLAAPQDKDSLIALFADRADGKLSINRYPEDEQGTATNAVFVAAPAAKKAWACRGPADRGTWEELSF